MSFMKDMWAIIVAAVMAWLSRIDNEVLNTVVQLLTITVILIGLTDWVIRKIRGRKAKNKTDGEDVLVKIESTQKPFKTVNMLDNPMGTSEAIGNFVDKISDNLKGGTKMKKFFKWIWYNKEQLSSIVYNVVVLALTNVLLFTSALDGFIAAYAGTTVAIAIKISAAVLGVLFTALTVRNVCVKYGLSSLTTIDSVLAERAATAAQKLPAEKKKELKTYIRTLQDAQAKAKAELADAEKALAEIVTMHNADASLVANFANRKSELDREIANGKAAIENFEKKIATYKAQLSGKN